MGTRQIPTGICKSLIRCYEIRRSELEYLSTEKLDAVLLLLGVGGALTWSIHQKLEDTMEKAARKADNPPAPVEVATIVHGPIELRRTFTGTLEAHAEFVAAPKVSGRVEQLHVDLADGVTRGQKDISRDLRRQLEGRIPGMTIRTRPPQGQFLLERLLASEEGVTVEARGFLI